MQKSIELREYGGGFLLATLVAVLVFGYVVLRPFLSIFLVALVLATIAEPAHVRLRRLTRGREGLAALITCFLVIVVLIVPCLVLLGLLAQQSVQLYEWVNQKLQSNFLDEDMVQRALEWQKRVLPQFRVDPRELVKSFTTLVGGLSREIVGLSAAVLKAVTTTLWQFFLMMVALFYLLKDGGKFLRWLLYLTPLPGSLRRELFQKFKGVSESAFYGAFLTALIQGVLGGVGFLIVGLQPLVWGAAMAFFSMVPVVGTALVWLPAGIILMANQHVGSGIFMMAWGLVVSLSDNFIRPMIMRGKSQLHPLLIFFSLLGGVFSFGPLGILLGPLAIVLAISMLQAYEAAARPVLEELDKR
ncbi:MAG: AI-2E family transporter [Thermodesulfobacteriota bacterium]